MKTHCAILLALFLLVCTMPLKSQSQIDIDDGVRLYDLYITKLTLSV